MKINEGKCFLKTSVSLIEELEQVDRNSPE